jgi:hypothetical protein
MLGTGGRLCCSSAQAYLPCNATSDGAARSTLQFHAACGTVMMARDSSLQLHSSGRRAGAGSRSRSAAEQISSAAIDTRECRRPRRRSPPHRSRFTRSNHRRCCCTISSPPSSHRRICRGAYTGCRNSFVRGDSRLLALCADRWLVNRIDLYGAVEK